MVKDKQVRRLKKLMKSERTLASAAAMSGMDEKTARKYRDLGMLPSEAKAPHTWRTRADPFTEMWEETCEKLRLAPGLEAKTLFEALQREHPGEFADGQLRTLQRRIKRWRATEGPAQEVYFPQQHVPGRRGQDGDPRLEHRLQAPAQRQPLGQRAGPGPLQAGERHRQLEQCQRVTAGIGQ